MKIKTRNASAIARSLKTRSASAIARSLKICLAVLAALLMVAVVPGQAQSKLNVIATTEDLAAIAREVGGDHITVDSIAKGYQDPHFVEAKPSFILKLQKADMLILVGRELEIGWLPPLIQQSRNRKDSGGRRRLSRCIAQAQILEVPAGTGHARRG